MEKYQQAGHLNFSLSRAPKAEGHIRRVPLTVAGQLCAVDQRRQLP